MMQLPERVEGLHHITVATGSAQGDVDLLVKTLGQWLVKKTMFYDGARPVYHLYFGNELGEPGTLYTTFPVRQAGYTGKRGAGQISAVSYNAPVGTLSWWQEHLIKRAVTVSEVRERFGQKYLSFEHPDCGVGFEIIEQDTDGQFEPWDSPYVPKEVALRGFHSWTATLNRNEEMDSFMRNAWNLKPQGRDGNYQRYAFGNGGAAKVLDVYIDEDERPGTWALGEGQVHHAAFEVADLDVQAALKFDVEGLGYTDFSDRKHRGYFESIYVRTPGGVLFEASVTLGFTHDESPEKLGSEVKVAPQLEGVKDELLRTMNDPIVI
uniref:HCH-ring cleavage dioxygenase LinE n=1 Tax=Pseudomonas aeruginosa TaxID=287 RepID=A5A0R5_PSEAI|nr:HCH-ring cleavage dioxygenase LinE [Pseudomonas aeruginosa]